MSVHRAKPSMSTTEENADTLPAGKYSHKLSEGQAIGRFAPSPSGFLHAGNIFAYLVSWLLVKHLGGKNILRIEDLDTFRSKRAYADRLMSDLEAMGLYWDGEPLFQSTRTQAYTEAFESLEARGMLYPCFCTRADLHAASAPHAGEKPIYSGKCSHLDAQETASLKDAGRPFSVRIRVPDQAIGFDDLLQGPYSQNLKDGCGDFVIRRSDGVFAYQLAVVADDAFQGVNFIVRGYDLLDSTPQQIYLQDKLYLPHLQYAHIPLMLDSSGRRLSKRNTDAGSDALRDRFGSWEAAIGRIAFVSGIIPEDEPMSPEDILRFSSFSGLAECLKGRKFITWE